MMRLSRDKPARKMIITKMKSPQTADPLQLYYLNSLDKVQGQSTMKAPLPGALHKPNTIIHVQILMFRMTSPK